MTEQKAITKSKTYLASQSALESVQRDPYWPKWDSPWWHMSLLNELGLARDIPPSTLSKMVQKLGSHYLPVFPIRESEIPPGTDPYRKVACLCAVGNMYQILFNAGVDVDRELPWMREWFFRYQLPDGGLNCDEKVYTKTTPKSSIVTTISCLEAVFFCRHHELTDMEVAFLNKGASYLLKQKLFRKVSTGEVIDKDWLEIRFPRYYEYDFLRGFYFLEKWRQSSGFSIPDELVDEVEQLVSKQMTRDGIKLMRYNLFDKRSYNPMADGQWAWGEASEFDLMKAVSFEGGISRVLTSRWHEVKPKTATVVESYASAYKNPIKLREGEAVKIENRETDLEWAGRIYCVNDRGTGGWVSMRFLNLSGRTATAIKDYDGSELTATADERLKVYFEEFGWCWSRKPNGAKGWIPKRNLKFMS